MQELNSARKIKINLADYDFEKDINNRLLMANFTEFDITVLEEILFNSIKIPILSLSLDLNCNLQDLKSTLIKLESTELFSIKEDIIYVNKSMRKYYEFQICKFQSNFKPDFDFLQCLLKKVPIQVLPIWYSLPKTSDNIFNSIIEKYLISPNIFQRHIEEIKSKDVIITDIIDSVYNSENLKIKSSYLKEKHNLTDYEFEKYMLILEFSFACCVNYFNENGTWVETITPFHEWQNYLKFLKTNHIPSIKNQNEIEKTYQTNFGYIKDLTILLEISENNKITTDNLNLQPLENKIQAITQKKQSVPLNNLSYIKQALDKLFKLNFITSKNNQLSITADGKKWNEFSLENKSLHLYQHPLNKVFNSPEYTNQNIKNAEKSITRVINSSWIYLDDFLNAAVITPIENDQEISLIQEGKHWKYFIPEYTQKHQILIKKVVSEKLFEAGIVEMGTHKGKDCFKVTPLGKKLFEFY